MIEDFVLLVLRSLRRRTLRSWLTMLGIFIGIAAVVSLISLGAGLKEAITGQFSEIGTDKLAITAASAAFGPPGSAANPLTEDDLDTVRKVRGFKVVAQRLIRSGSVEFNDIQRFEFIVSMPDEPDERRLIEEALSLEAAEGRLLKKGDKFKIVLGQDYITQDFFDKKLRVGNNILIEGKNFKIIGFLKKLSNPQFNDIVLMNEDVMRDLLNLGNEVDVIVGQVSNVNDIDKVALNVERELRKKRDVEKGKEDFSVETPQQILETFNLILNLVQAIIVGIAGISLVVGGVGIANTMFTSVLERRKEIGVMKAIGARNSSILLIFLLESGFLGFFGGLIGVGLGIILSKIVEVIGAQIFGEGLLIAQFSPTLIIGALVFSSFVGALSGIIPARQASLLPPVEALRK